MLSGIPGRPRDRLRSFLVFIQYSFPVLLKKWQHGTLSAAQGVFMRKYITDAEWYVFSTPSQVAGLNAGIRPCLKWFISMVSGSVN
uniref:hypothetical protein n=1 Tax=Salmonella enterica TaxID=28901 RepID=UPI00155DA1A8|nr:hypothetical protein [Salmonella enterica]